MFMSHWLHRLLKRKPKLNAIDRQARRRRLHLEQLEDRLAPATFTEAGTQLNLVLYHENVAIVANGTNYTLTLTNGGSWNGIDNPEVAGNGTSTLTVSSAGIAAFTTAISIADNATGTGASVTFNDSGANAYANNFTIGLHNSPAIPGLTFNGTSAFGTHNLTADVDSSISLAGGAQLSTTSGTIDLKANTSGATSGNFNGIEINNALVTSATGAITLAGQGGNTGGYNFGVFVHNGAVVSSTGTATITINGTGGSVGSGNYGVVVTDTGTKVTSKDGAVQITGQGGGSNDTDEKGLVIASGAVVSSTGTATLTLEGTGGATGSGNYGVYITDTGTKVTSVDGAVQITGQGGGTIFSNAKGLVIASGAVVSSTGTATLTLEGTGGSAGSGNDGVVITDTGTKVTSVDGAVQITGKGGGGSDDTDEKGLVIESGAVVSSTGAATLTLEGTGGSVGFGSNYGIFITGSDTQVTSVDGAVQITGQGGGVSSSSDEKGLVIASGAEVSSTGTATLTLEGTGGSAGDGNYGVCITDTGTKVTSANGAVQITGQGGGDASNSDGRGLLIASGAVVTSTGTGVDAATITLDGTGGSGTANNDGVDIGGSVTSVDGAIQITGQGGTTATDTLNIGIRVYNGGQVTSTGTATITINGTGGSGTGENYGVDIEGSGALVTSVAGAIQITGQGGSTTATGGLDIGVFVLDGGQVTSTGTATITINGTGGSGTDQNDGVAVQGTGALVTSVAGAIQITGQGGTTATGGLNIGVLVVNGGQVTSTGTGVDAATITINGTGGSGTDSNYGVYVAVTGALVTSKDGAIQITGQGGGTTATGRFNDGVAVLSDGQVTSTGTAAIALTGTAGAGASNFAINLFSRAVLDTSSGTGNITLTGDSMNFDATSAIDAGANIVTLQPKTLNTAINLGGADAPGTLGLTNDELSHITAGILRIGDTSGTSSDITITSAITDVGTGWSTLSLLTNSGSSAIISQSSGGALTVQNLSAFTSQRVILTDPGNTVAQLSGISSGAFTFVNSTSLTIGSVDPGIGFAGLGSLFSGTVSVTALGTGSVLTVNNPIDMNQFGKSAGNITLSADDMAINAVLNAPGHTVTLQQGSTTTRDIDLGLGTTANTLGLSDTELGQITANSVQIGRSDNPGNLTVTGNVTTHAGFSTLTLLSGGAVSATSGSTVTVTNLAVQAGTGIGAAATPLTTAISNLAAKTTTGGIFLNNTSDLTIGFSGAPFTGVQAATSGDIQLSVATGKALSVSSGHAVSTASGDIALQADSMTLSDTVSAGTGIVTLDVATLNRRIDLGTNPSPGKLGLSQADLNHITAGILRIGDYVGTNSDITITSAITDVGTGWSTLFLLTNSSSSSSISQSSGAALTVQNLSAFASQQVALTDPGNTVAQLSGLSAGDFTFVNSASLTIGNAAPGIGFAGLGSLFSGTVSVTALGAGSVLTVNNAIDMAQIGNSGDVILSADDMAINAVLNAPGKTVTLQQSSAAANPPDKSGAPPGPAPRDIDLGLGTTANTLGLSDTELGQITADDVQIGRIDNAGNLTVTGNVTTHAGFSTLTLRSGGAISENGGSGSISVNVLSTNSVHGATLNGPNTVNAFAASNTADGDIVLTNTAPTLTVNQVTQASGADISLANTGTMTIASAIAGSGAKDVTLTTLGAGHDVNYGGFGFSNALNGTLTVNSAGAITKAGVGDDIRAKAVVLNAVNGIGTSADPIQVNTNSLIVTNSTSGDVFLTATGGNGHDTTTATLTNAASSGNISVTTQFNCAIVALEVNLDGTFTLNDEPLDASTITNNPGQSITWVDNTSANPASSLAGLPENAAVSINGIGFALTYFGGDGNDTVLLQVDTQISLDNLRNLVITDVGTVSADQLTVQADAANHRFVITDPNLILSTNIGGASGSLTHTVFVPFSAVTGTGVQVSTGGGDDAVTITGFGNGGWPKKILTVDGGTGSDTVNLTATDTLAAGDKLTVSAETVSFSSSSLTISGGNLSGTADNLNLGSLSLTSGTLDASHFSSINVSGDWSQTGGTFTPGTNTVAFTGAAAVMQTLDSNGTPFYNLNHSGAGALQLVGHALSVGGLLSNTGTLALNGQGLTVAGPVSNAGTIALQGTEAVTLALGNDTAKGTWKYFGNNTAGPITIKDFGNSDYFNLSIRGGNAITTTFQTGAALRVGGALTVTAGIYDANGNTTSVDGLTTIDGGTYLTGTASQTLSGGLTVSSGTFTAAPRTINAGAIALASGSHFGVVVNDPSGPGASYTQYNATGTVNLGNATLDISGNIATTSGSRTIISNDGAGDAVVGTFLGLPEGQTFIVGGTLFQISYAGGDGNDVVLTAVDPINTSLQGTSGDDIFAVSRNGVNVEVQLNGNLIYTGMPTSLHLSGGSGDDQLIVDYSGGDPQPGGGLQFDGGSDEDQLIIQGNPAPFPNIATNFSGNGLGSITSGAVPLTFTGLETVDLTLAAITHVILNYSAAAESITLGPDSSNPAWTEIASTAAPRTVLNDATLLHIFDGNNDTDPVNFGSFGSGFTGAWQVGQRYVGDGFNRADAGNLGVLTENWLARLGNLAVAGAQAVGNGGLLNLAVVRGVQLSDAAVTATVTLQAHELSYAGVVARYNGSGEGSMYFGTLVRRNGQVYAEIWRRGGAAVLLSQQVVSVSSGVLRLEVIGDRQELFLNDQLVGFSNDTVLSGPGQVGIYADQNATADSFAAEIVPPSVASLLFQDDFSQSDRGQLDSAWLGRLGNFTQQGAQAVGNGGLLNLAVVRGVQLSDAAVTATVTLQAHELSYAGVVARYNGSGEGSMYFGTLVRRNGQVYAEIWRRGGAPVLLSQQVVSVSSGVLRLEVVGDRQELFLNDQLVGFSNDTVLSGPGQVGIYADQNAAVDNFAADVVPPSVASLPFQDDFSQSDRGQLDSAWLGRLGNIAVAGAQAVGNGGLLNLAVVRGVQLSDAAVTATVTLQAHELSYAGVVARYNGSGEGSMYFGTLVRRNGQVYAEIWRRGGAPVLLSQQVVSVSSGVLRLEVKGNEQKLFLNNQAVGSATDNAIQGPGLVGMYAGQGAILDDFSADAI